MSSQTLKPSLARLKLASRMRYRPALPMLFDLLDDLRRGKPLNIGDQLHLFDNVRAHDLFAFPVRAFNKNVGPNGLDDFLRSVFIENHDKINAFQSRQNSGAGPLVDDGTGRTFDAADGPIT